MYKAGGRRKGRKGLVCAEDRGVEVDALELTCSGEGHWFGDAVAEGKISLVNNRRLSDD